MRSLLVAAAIMLLVVMPAAASDKSDVLRSAHRWSDAFSRGNFRSDNAPCTADAVVIDDFAPHVWQGRDACSQWFKAFEAWAASAAVTDARITLGRTRHLDVEGRYAYFIAPVTLVYTKAGNAVNFPGTITLTLRKAETGWLVSGVSWADK